MAHWFTNIIVYHPLHTFVRFHYFTSRYCMTSSFASNQSNKQRLRSQELRSYYGQPSRPPSQRIFKTIDIERSMEGRCRTSLFLFSNKWLIGQGLVYLPLFEGAWTVMTFNLCCWLGCSHARDKSDQNHVGILTCLTSDLVPKILIIIIRCFIEKHEDIALVFHVYDGHEIMVFIFSW